MASNKILSQQDINRFRSEIQSEFGYYDPKIHSKLFSERVHCHLDHQIETIGIQNSEKLKRKLIQKTIVTGKSDVTLDDLKNCCSDLKVHIPWKLKSVERKVLVDHRNKNIHSFSHSIIIFFFLCWGAMGFAPFKSTLSEIEISAPKPQLHPLFVTKSTAHEDLFSYKQIHHPMFIHYITQKRNGLIGQPQYYYKIILLAKHHNIDPLLLFAIIGQEQSFVPLSNKEAHIIMNNPFNVYHSWQDFNTNLSESTMIAINTIRNRLEKRPKNQDPFIWLNGIYAEDPDWHIGVRSFYLFFQKHYSLTYDEHSIPPVLDRVK